MPLCTEPEKAVETWQHRAQQPGTMASTPLGDKLSIVGVHRAIRQVGWRVKVSSHARQVHSEKTRVVYKAPTSSFLQRRQKPCGSCQGGRGGVQGSPSCCIGQVEGGSVNPFFLTCNRDINRGVRVTSVQKQHQSELGLSDLLGTSRRGEGLRLGDLFHVVL